MNILCITFYVAVGISFACHYIIFSIEISFLLSVKALTGILVEHISQAGNANRSIVLYPNSGEEWDARSEAWLEGTGTTAPEDFAQGIMTTVGDIHKRFQPQAGPNIIVGGCCRTTPETIAAIRHCIDAKEVQPE